MNWKHVKSQLPEENTPVVVWMKHEDGDFCWTDTELDNPENDFYIEPNSGRQWMMGSARNYIITHWSYVTPPKKLEHPIVYPSVTD